MNESRPFKFEEFITTVFGVEDPQPEVNYEYVGPRGELQVHIEGPMYPADSTEVWRYLDIRVGGMHGKYMYIREINGDAGTWAEFIAELPERRDD